MVMNAIGSSYNGEIVFYKYEHGNYLKYTLEQKSMKIKLKSVNSIKRPLNHSYYLYNILNTF